MSKIHIMWAISRSVRCLWFYSDKNIVLSPVVGHLFGEKILDISLKLHVDSMNSLCCSLAAHGHRIGKLEIETRDSFDMDSILTSCPHLQDLDMCSGSFRQLTSRGNRLRRLKLILANSEFDPEPLADLHLVFPLLSHLFLNCEISELHQFQYCRSLVSIDLMEHVMFTAEDIAAITIGCTRLMTIRLNAHITDDCLQHIGANCAHLESLQLFDSPDMTMLGLQLVSQGICKHTLTSLCVGFGCLSLEQQPGPAFENLTCLNLRGLNRMTDMQLLSFVTDRDWSLLRKLCVPNCDKLTDLSLCVIARACVSLEEVQISSLRRITDAAIEAFFSCGDSHIRVFAMDGCVQVTDCGLACVAVCGVKLQELRCYGMPCITSEALCQLTDGVPQLRRLYAKCWQEGYSADLKRWWCVKRPWVCLW